MYFDDEGDLKEYGGKTGLLQRRAAKWRSRVLRWAFPAVTAQFPRPRPPIIPVSRPSVSSELGVLRFSVCHTAAVRPDAPPNQIANRVPPFSFQGGA